MLGADSVVHSGPFWLMDLAIRFQAYLQGPFFLNKFV